MRYGILSDTHANIEALGDKGMIPPDLVTSLRRMNGLRNVLVHHYNKVELEMVLQEKENVVKSLEHFMEIVEEKVHQDAPVVGKAIKDIPLPKECVLVAILRKGQLIIPRGDTVMGPVDEVIALVHVSQMNNLNGLLSRPKPS